MADITKINLNGTSYNIKDATGGGGAVSSVNGKTGTVVLNSDDLAYNSSATHPNGTVGKELKEQSQEIANINTELAKKRNRISQVKVLP